MLKSFAGLWDDLPDIQGVPVKQYAVCAFSDFQTSNLPVDADGAGRIDGGTGYRGIPRRTWGCWDRFFTKSPAFCRSIFKMSRVSCY